MLNLFHKRHFLFSVSLGGVLFSQKLYAEPNELSDIISEQIGGEVIKIIQKPQAIFQALNKISGRSNRLIATVNEPIRFEDLEITIKTCQERPPEFIPESATFVKAKELSTRREVFSGWMFASAPSLSPFEHPLFDLYLIGCKETNENVSVKSGDMDLSALKAPMPRPTDLGRETLEETVDINSLLE